MRLVAILVSREQLDKLATLDQRKQDAEVARITGGEPMVWRGKGGRMWLVPGRKPEAPDAAAKTV